MKKLTLELIGTDRQNVFVPLFVVVGGTNYTYRLTSKQNILAGNVAVLDVVRSWF